MKEASESGKLFKFTAKREGKVGDPAPSILRCGLIAGKSKEAPKAPSASDRDETAFRFLGIFPEVLAARVNVGAVNQPLLLYPKAFDHLHMVG